MDSKLSRWAIVCFLDQPSLNYLHRQEKKAGKDWTSVLMRLKPGFVSQFQLSPYWPDSMPEMEKELRLQEFNREIFPIWGKMWSEWEKTWEQSDCELEIDVMHRCDLAIFNGCCKVNRIYLGDPATVKRNAAKAQSYGKQYQQAMEG